MSNVHLLISEEDIRSAVATAALSAAGKHYGRGRWSPYGEWYGWPTAYFCAAGWSWSWHEALGDETAFKIIDRQIIGGMGPNKRGYIWTVALYEQHKADKYVSRNELYRLKPGDALMFKYPTSGTRNTAVVNHVDVVIANRPDLGYLDCVGFNVENPSAPAGSDQSLGGGVWKRRIYYTNRYIVCGFSFTSKIRAVVSSHISEWIKVQRNLSELGIEDFNFTGVPGPKTLAAVKVYAADYGYSGDLTNPYTLSDHMEKTVSKILAALDRIEKKVDALPTAEANADSVWNKKFYGFATHYWIRQGSLGSHVNHPHFPADPGSPADYGRRAAMLILNEDIPPYTGVDNK